jgi:murein DD-endopeptidase MepM/ murein hydrolase activator NlpD
MHTDAITAGALRTFLAMLLTFALCIPATPAAAQTAAETAAQTTRRPTAREGADHAVPLYGDLIRTWDAPDDDPFAPGHRGIDVAAPEGTPVRASADGTVSFAGSVAGNRSVTVDHGDELLTSYSFLDTLEVAKGDEVELGDVIGTVGPGHPKAAQPHVHLSARRGGTYVDPIGLYIGTDLAGLVALTA